MSLSFSRTPRENLQLVQLMSGVNLWPKCYNQRQVLGKAFDWSSLDLYTSHRSAAAS